MHSDVRQSSSASASTSRVIVPSASTRGMIRRRLSSSSCLRQNYRVSRRHTPLRVVYMSFIRRDSISSGSSATSGYLFNSSFVRAINVDIMVILPLH